MRPGIAGLLGLLWLVGCGTPSVGREAPKPDDAAQADAASDGPPLAADSSGASCLGGLLCFYSHLDKNGNCVKEFLPAGKGCSSDADPCIKFACDGAGLCIGKVQLAAPCTLGTGPCTATGTCDEAGLCQATTLATVPCLAPPNPCLSAFCAAPGVCGKVVAEVGKACAKAPICHEPFCDATGFCGTPSAAGKPCDLTDPCLADGVCDGKGSCVGQIHVGKVCDKTVCKEKRCTATGQCEPVPTVGQACADSGDPCRPGVCDESGYCVYGTAPGAKCISKYPCHGPGICKADGKCLSAVEPGKTCDGGPCVEAGKCTAAGKCVGKVKLDAPCEGSICQVPDKAKCQADGSCGGSPVPDGTSCEAVYECTSPDECKKGKCVHGAPGMSSPFKSQCGKYICDYDTGYWSFISMPGPCGGAGWGGGDCTTGYCMPGDSACYGMGCYDSSGKCKNGQPDQCVKLTCGENGTCMCDSGTCNDHNPCTADQCPNTGCAYVPIETGIACGNDRVCKLGQCILPF